ncbi:gas vesicle protein GvpO [Streptosporangium sp. NPDC051022]|uniref:gas vesicle protein GvpO n=1 Tax=Streptosporangium sp. NPDC051022 TaxID=3155752 RepID=UPI00342DAE67
MPARRRGADGRDAATGTSRDRYDENDEAFDEVLDDEEVFEEDEVERVPGKGRRSRALSAATAGKVGLRNIADLTAKEVEGVTLVQPTEEGWKVGVEVVEDRRVPSSGDILALYEVDLDPWGDLRSYRRLRRYKRGRGDSEGS